MHGGGNREFLRRRYHDCYYLTEIYVLNCFGLLFPAGLSFWQDVASSKCEGRADIDSGKEAMTNFNCATIRINTFPNLATVCPDVCYQQHSCSYNMMNRGRTKMNDHRLGIQPARRGRQ